MIKTVIYMSAKLQRVPVLIELTFPASSQGCTVVTKTPDANKAQVTQNVLSALLSAPQ